MIVGEYEGWLPQIEQSKRMREWVLQAEHILDGSWAARSQEVNNAEVGKRFDAWHATLQTLSTAATLSAQEQKCLDHFVKVTTNLRPGLIQCYDREGFPRTNNTMEGSIRAIKTRYRRISGRQNWNSYLLRYGSSVAYYDCWARQEAGKQNLEMRLKQVPPQRWREVRKEIRCSQSEQLKRFRFLHRRQTYLASLEQRWAQAACM
jgi:hypothetical protein